MAVIRRAERRDRERVLELWDRCGLGATEDDEWEALINGDSASVLVAQEGDVITGTAVSSFDGWRAYIYHVAVEPEARGQGLARELMDAAERDLASRGARRVFLTVHEENTGGLALSVNGGYLPDGEISLVKELAGVASGSRSAW